MLQDNGFNIHKVEVQEDRWPWTNEWLKDKRSGLSSEQCKEIGVKANDKFAEISRVAIGLGEEYSPDSQRKWQLDVDHRFLNEIVEEVVGRHGAAVVDSANKSSATVAAVVAGSTVQDHATKENDHISENTSKRDDSSSKEKYDQQKQSSKNSVAAVAVVSQSDKSVEEEAEEEKKKKRKAEQESSANDQSTASSTDGSNSSKSDSPKKEEQKGGVEKSTGASDRNVVIVPAVLESNPEEEYLHMNKAPAKISRGQTEELLSQFRNYGMPIGFPGGTRSKVKNMAKNANFAFEEADSLIVQENKGALEVTFNGDCEREKYIELKHNCYVRVDYDNQTGAVAVVKNTVFHKVDDEFRIIDMKKTGGWFGKSDLEKELGNKQDYKDVKQSLKDLKIIACSNPTPIDGVAYEDQPRAQVAAMADGKTHGSRLSNLQKVGLAVGLAAVGTVAVLSGVGIVPGIGALLGAGGLITSGVSTAATATASGTTMAANTVASGVVTAANAIGNGLTPSSVTQAANVVKDGTVMAANKTAEGTVMAANKTAEGSVMAANTVASHTPQAVKNAANVVVDGTVMAANKTASAAVTASKSAYAIPVAAGVGGLAIGATATSVYNNNSGNER